MANLTTRIVLCSVAICGTWLASSVSARQDATQPAAAVNAMCPIGKEPIDPGVKTLAYKGKQIGFCCPGCETEFNGWAEKERDAFVALAVAHKEPGQPDKAAEPAKAQKSEVAPYTLATCPISGLKLDKKGEPVVREYEGREVKFCCGGCPPAFEKDLKASFAKLDEQIIKDQLPLYPVDTCVVSDETLGGNHMEAVNVVFQGRLVRLCCKACKRDLTDDPKTFLAKLDKAIVAKQAPAYALETCVVSGEKLDSMGKPIDMVIGNRLIKLCCKGCAKDVRKDPAKYIAIVDAANQKGAK